MNKHLILILFFLLGITFSAIQPHDYFTWILEVFPAILGFFILLFTFHKFEFSYLSYVLILIHCYILFVGGHYTYAEVPLLEDIKIFFHQSRNNYDKVGHFAQGFVPAFIIRELFVRMNIVNSDIWRSFLTIFTCMSLSVLYEFLEWFVATFTGESADSFLGTQGYVWDTQSDMLWATFGAITMIVFFSKIQDKSINKVILKKTVAQPKSE
jgi:putative membrane protein